MPQFTLKEQKQIIAAIRKRTNAFIGKVLGSSMVSHDDIVDLWREGLIDDTVQPGLIQNSFVLGKLRAHLAEAQYRRLTLPALMERIEQHPPTDYERHFFNYLETDAASYVQGLADDIRSGVFSAITRADRRLMTEDSVKEHIRRRLVSGARTDETYDQLASDLGSQFKTWKRNWNRIASTEMWNAKEQGHAMSVLHGEGAYADLGGPDAQVAKMVRPDACPDCRKHYLDEQGEPKVFKLSVLMANGSNVGIKRKDWLPTVGSLHPYCNCHLVAVPDGYSFEGGILTPP